MGWKDTVKSALEYNPTKHVLKNILNPKKAIDTATNEMSNELGAIAYAAANKDDEEAQTRAADAVQAIFGTVGPLSIQGKMSKGWSKAQNKYSGLWDKMERAQVSDVGQSLTPEAHQMLRKTGGARFAMDNLEKKVASGELSPAQAHAIIQDAKGIFPDMKLSDIYKHPEMSKNYPDIYKDTKVVFEYTPEATKGWLDTAGNYHVNLSQINSAQDWLGNLVHEIGTHKIQNLEGMGKGASIGNIRSTKEYILKDLMSNPNFSREEARALAEKVRKVNPVAEYAETGGEVEARYNREIMNKKLDEILGIQPLSTEEIPLKHIKSADTWDWGPRRALKDISLREEPLQQDPKSLVESLGFVHNGISPAHKSVPEMHWFTDPATGGTYTLPSEQMTMEGLTNKINAKRAEFGAKPLKAQEDLNLGGKPTPSQAIDRWYAEGSKRAKTDLEGAAKYGENPYDYNKQGAEASLMNAQDEGPTGFAPYLKQRAENLGLPVDVQAAFIAQSGTRRNFQMHPTVEKALDDFLNEHLDMTPKAKKPLPFENKPVEVGSNPENVQKAKWFDETNKHIYDKEAATPSVDEWAAQAKTESEMADDIKRMNDEQVRNQAAKYFRRRFE